jgi:hypothetical protein
LLLDNSPLPRSILLCFNEVAHQLGPLNSGFDLDLSFVRVELQNTVQRSGIQQDCARAELLPAHRVPPPGDADSPPFRSRSLDCHHDIFDRTRPDDSMHTRQI